MADTGWVMCGTGGEDNSYGTYAWTNASNITSDNNVYATSQAFMGSADTYYLTATNFGLTVPNSTIDGIEFRVRAYSDDSVGTAGDLAQSNLRVRVIKGGVIGSSGDSLLNTTNLSETALTSGSPSALWGETWVYSDVNASNFGVAISFELFGVSGVDIYVDSVEVKVHYTVDTTPGTMGNPSGALLGIL